MKRLFLLAVLGALGATLPASERAVVKIVCPLDGTEFEAIQDFSGYAEGQRLDLKKLGPISQPSALPRCPRCSLPLFDKYPDEALKTRLRAVLAGKRFQAEALSVPPWFALGILREELEAEPYEIAWTYLQASWEAEEGNPDGYTAAARRAIGWFDRAAAELVKQPERRRDYHIALYLPVELARRSGDFGEARRRLGTLPEFPVGDESWLHSAVEAQRPLIAAGVSTADDQLPAPAVRP